MQYYGVTRGSLTGSPLRVPATLTGSYGPLNMETTRGLFDGFEGTGSALVNPGNHASYP